MRKLLQRFLTVVLNRRYEVFKITCNGEVRYVVEPVKKEDR